MQCTQPPTLIFLPGASGSSDFWQPVAAHFPNYPQRILSYPGFANCSQIAEVNSLETLEKYILQQITQPSILIAQSMGGIFAVKAALAQSQQVQALVLVATSGGVDLSQFQLADWRDDYLKHYASYPDWFTKAQDDYTAQLAEINLPCLLIWGDADLISPVAVGQFLQGKIKQAQLVVIPNGQHDMAFTQADLVAQHIQQFLQGRIRKGGI